MLKYDSTHGQFKGTIETYDQGLIVTFPSMLSAQHIAPSRL
jgi:glyceraldehyde-3-phosphate dehydrogenase/erythrose-4-phosphate dehydrogenase